MRLRAGTDEAGLRRVRARRCDPVRRVAVLLRAALKRRAGRGFTPRHLARPAARQLRAHLHHRQPHFGAVDQTAAAPASIWPAPGSAPRTAAGVSSATLCHGASAASACPAAAAFASIAKLVGLADAPTAGSRRRRRPSVHRNIARLRRSGRESRRTPASRSIDCARSALQSFMPTMLGCWASFSSVSLVRLTAERYGNVVEHDRPGGMIGQRGEMLQQPALRRSRIIGARNQITVDRPRRRFIQRILHLRGTGAGQPEADRQMCAGVGHLGSRHARPAVRVRRCSSVMPSPEVAARIKPSTGPLSIMPHQPAQRSARRVRHRGTA